MKECRLAVERCERNVIYDVRKRETKSINVLMKSIVSCCHIQVCRRNKHKHWELITAVGLDVAQRNFDGRIDAITDAFKYFHFTYESHYNNLILLDEDWTVLFVMCLMNRCTRRKFMVIILLRLNCWAFLRHTKVFTPAEITCPNQWPYCKLRRRSTTGFLLNMMRWVYDIYIFECRNAADSALKSYTVAMDKIAGAEAQCCEELNVRLYQAVDCYVGCNTAAAGEARGS